MSETPQRSFDETRRLMREIWPALSDMLDNPALHETLEREGIAADREAIRRFSEELNIHVAICADERVRFSAAYSRLATSAVKVFSMNDCDWMAATSLDEAKRAYLQFYAMSSDEAFDCPHELTAAEIETLNFVDGDVRRTFAEQLALEISRGQKFPCFFASREF